MVKATQSRAVVAWAQEAYRLSQPRACRAVSAPRSSVRYRSIKRSREPLRRRLREFVNHSPAPPYTISLGALLSYTRQGELPRGGTAEGTSHTAIGFPEWWE